ncbi:hypothetical protein LJR245_007270 [Rhizobium leguminosarum]|uniref:hypothetical protein n=1 Tax=Rhizobium leguminosarum TaxID=384 RepID=UPI00143F950C|nr:hypothetical protein [Rhizobium leguminosarum]MBY5840895.1 hypothetical protein [Rhizobium leguminosarum]MBY5869170.1 hypothetical protein [Rhizobium leguminosarum]MCA2410867.1 hypothetical protein [Rhizobium leguminosarum]QSZ12090.1 hypothetical protein J3P71_32905 [Rhizobium leguminosarum]
MNNNKTAFYARIRCSFLLPFGSEVPASVQAGARRGQTNRRRSVAGQAMLQDVLSRRFSGLPVGANFVDQVRVTWYIWQTTGAAPLKPKTRPWNDQGGGRETLISR